MQYRTVPKTGDNISALGFGCMRFPEKNGRIDKKRAAKQAAYAIEHGINYFDTGYIYHMGASEPFLGQIITPDKRKSIKIATKLFPFSVKKPADMDKVLENQLQRLRTSYLDYYLLHGIDGPTWKNMYIMDVLDFLCRAKAGGHIRNAGFSWHGDLDAFKSVVDACDWEFCRIQYNYMDTPHQAGTQGLEYAAS